MYFTLVCGNSWSLCCFIGGVLFMVVEEKHFKAKILWYCDVLKKTKICRQFSNRIFHPSILPFCFSFNDTSSPIFHPSSFLYLFCRHLIQEEQIEKNTRNQFLTQSQNCVIGLVVRDFFFLMAHFEGIIH